MEPNEYILTAENIHREFATADANLQVLKGLSLELKPGEIAAVTGASGVGKSTLLHILGGLDRPTQGEVRIAGTSLGGQSESDLAQLRNEKVGFVFQFHYLMQDFSARENVMLPMMIAGHSRRQSADKAELLLSQVGLKDRKSHRPSQLSGGEQQRVAVARALANDPEVVLADEPSGNLDTTTGSKLHELLFRLNEDNGTAFLIATHNTDLARRCNRELRIEDGRIRNQDS